MRYQRYEATDNEPRMLCGLALACYATTVIALAVLAYSVFLVALDSADYRINLIYSPFGI